MSEQPAIIFDQVSKRYHKRAGAASVWEMLFGGRRTDDEFWALKDIGFEVRPGEIVGIVGRNGSGKSTLLKLAARITRPTSGRIVTNGRVGSLLEVGAGFHRELTGRENIYLSGAILGMKRAEIKKRFDEIVDFSGVEDFIDTPVKRYSSGMYVRLAFAIAAHLQPEILLVDEVLAVGDAEFQKKCLGKMDAVAAQGRTVLFVSHNMTAIQNLCPRALYLSNGGVAADGNVRQVLDDYLSSTRQPLKSVSPYHLPRSKDLGGQIRFSKCSILDSTGNVHAGVSFGEPFSVYLEALAKSDLQALSVIVRIESFDGAMIAGPASEDDDKFFSASPSQPLRVIAHFNDLALTPGVYWLTIGIRSGRVGLDQLVRVKRFEVLQTTYGDVKPYSGAWGYIHLAPQWERVDRECP